MYTMYYNIHNVLHELNVLFWKKKCKLKNIKKFVIIVRYIKCIILYCCNINVHS